MRMLECKLEEIHNVGDYYFNLHVSSLTISTSRQRMQHRSTLSYAPPETTAPSQHNQ